MAIELSRDDGDLGHCRGRANNSGAYLCALCGSAVTTPDDTYIADPDTFDVEVHREGGQIEALDPRFDLRRHSPDGFNWGYEGSGPAQLALALCADVLRDDGRAVASYQTFKRKWVSQQPQGEAWAVKRETIDTFIKELERDNPPIF
jgi:hypothetical protein